MDTRSGSEAAQYLGRKRQGARLPDCPPIRSQAFPAAIFLGRGAGPGRFSRKPQQVAEGHGAEAPRGEAGPYGGSTAGPPSKRKRLSPGAGSCALDTGGIRRYHSRSRHCGAWRRAPGSTRERAQDCRADSATIGASPPGAARNDPGPGCAGAFPAQPESRFRQGSEGSECPAGDHPPGC